MWNRIVNIKPTCDKFQRGLREFFEKKLEYIKKASFRSGRLKNIEYDLDKILQLKSGSSPKMRGWEYHMYDKNGIDAGVRWKKDS